MSLSRHRRRRARDRRLGGLALRSALVLLLVASGSPVAAAEDPFTNFTGLASGDAEAVGGSGRLAGMSLNPGSLGQVLFGPYYDVRTVDFGGLSDTQTTLVTIRNESTPDKKSSAYDANGGVLLRLRLRESKYGIASDNVDLALGCGQIWTGTISRGEDGIPRIRSTDPVVNQSSVDSVVTEVLLDLPEGEALGWPSGLDRPLDLQRGFVEVFANEALPCTPVDPPISRSGNVWQRLGGGPVSTPPNSLSGDVVVAQALRATGFAYAMTAVARYRLAGSGRAISSLLAAEVPTLASCLGPVNTPQPSIYTGSPACIRQANFALSMARLGAPFESSEDGAATRLVLSFPTRPYSCLLNVANGSLSQAYPGTPFSCAATGERIAVQVEDLSDGFVPRATALLDRVTTLVGIGPAPDPIADVWIPTDGIEAGAVTVDLVRDGSGSVQHLERAPQLDRIDLLGVGFAGYDGLPVLAVGLREAFSELGGGARAWTFRPESRVAHVIP